VCLYLKTVPLRMFLMVPLGLFHIFFSLNSSTRASSGVMVAHLMPTLYFCRDFKVAQHGTHIHRPLQLQLTASFFISFTVHTSSLSLLYILRQLWAPSILTADTCLLRAGDTC